MMLNRKELEPLHPTTLAVLCQKLADVCSDAPTAEKCCDLKAEWVLLQNPPSPRLREEQEKDAKCWDLRQRMIEVLAGRDEVGFYPNA
jgi:hypothetical protein